jgi:hypothetical protein
MSSYVKDETRLTNLYALFVAVNVLASPYACRCQSCTANSTLIKSHAGRLALGLRYDEYCGGYLFCAYRKLLTGGLDPQ